MRKPMKSNIKYSIPRMNLSIMTKVLVHSIGLLTSHVLDCLTIGLIWLRWNICFTTKIDSLIGAAEVVAEAAVSEIAAWGQIDDGCCVVTIKTMDMIQLYHCIYPFI